MAQEGKGTSLSSRAGTIQPCAQPAPAMPVSCCCRTEAAGPTPVNSACWFLLHCPKSHLQLPKILGSGHPTPWGRTPLAWPGCRKGQCDGWAGIVNPLGSSSN